MSSDNNSSNNDETSLLLINEPRNEIATRVVDNPTRDRPILQRIGTLILAPFKPNHNDVVSIPKPIYTHDTIIYPETSYIRNCIPFFQNLYGTMPLVSLSGVAFFTALSMIESRGFCSRCGWWSWTKGCIKQ